MSFATISEALRIIDKAREVGRGAVAKVRNAGDDAERWAHVENILEKLVTVSYAQNEALQLVGEMAEEARTGVRNLEKVDA